MTPTIPYNIFNSQGCITPEALSMFIDKKLSVEEERQLRAHAKTCALCKDAMEGAVLFNSSKQYQSRISSLHNTKFRRSFNKKEKSRSLYYGVSAAAASLILFFGIFFMLRLEKIVDDGFTEIALQEDFFIKSDSIQPPMVNMEQSAHRKENQQKPPDNRQSRKPQQKPIRPLKPNDDVVIADIEEEIIIEDIEFNGLEYDVELKTIPINSFEAEKERIKANNSASRKLSQTPESMQKELQASNETDNQDKKTNRKKSKNKHNRKNNNSYYMAEVTPMFQGGNIDSFNSYLADNLKVIIPDSVLIESVIISFVIDTAGNISKVKLVSGTSSEELNKHILEFVQESPVWMPGYTHGNPVESYQESTIVLDSVDNMGLQ